MKRLDLGESRIAQTALRLIVILASVSVFGSSQASESSIDDLLGSLLSMRYIGVGTVTANDRPTLSPDGSWLAYTVKESGQAPVATHRLSESRALSSIPKNSRLVVQNLVTGARHDISPYGAASWLPVWSPDSRSLAFYAAVGEEGHLWMFETASRRSYEVSALPIHFSLNDAAPVQWSSDGGRVLISVEAVDRDASKSQAQLHVPQAASVSVYTTKAGESSGFNAEAPLQKSFQLTPSARLIILSVKEKPAGVVESTVVLETAARPATFGMYSESGRWIAYLSPPTNMVASTRGKRNPTAVAEVVSNLTIIPATGGGAIFETENIDFPNSPTSLPMWLRNDVFIYSRAGRLNVVRLGNNQAVTETVGPSDLRALTIAEDKAGSGVVAVGGYTGSSANYDRGNSVVWIPQRDSASAIEIKLPVGLKFMSLVTSRRHTLWQPAPNTVTLICASTDGTGDTALVRIKIPSGATQILWRGQGRILPVDVVPDHSQLIARFEDQNTAPDLWLLSATGQRQQRLTDLNPGVKAVEVGKVLYLSTPVPVWDGRLVDTTSAIILPKNVRSSDRLPAVVTMYPSDRKFESASKFGGGSEAGVPTAVLLRKGYAVIYADLPTRPLNTVGNRAQEATDALLPQVYNAASKGYIDINRVALFGWSQGGYTAVAIATRSNLFRAVVAGGAAYDLGGQYGYMASGKKVGDRWAELALNVGGPPWEVTSRYIENSPYYQVSKIMSPILLLVGDQDAEGRALEHLKMFSALQTAGKTAELAVYEGEGHVLFGGSRPNSDDVCLRMLRFLDLQLR